RALRHETSRHPAPRFRAGVAYGRAEEPALFVRHLQEPARPAPWIAANRGIGKVAHGRQRLFASGRSVWQFDPFVIRQDAIAEAEMEEIERHDAAPLH